MEADMIPATAAPQLKLTVTAIIGGFRLQILSTDLANSSVQPGLLYTVTFSIVPNDGLSGQQVGIEAKVTHGSIEEICAVVQVRIN
jgi:hypothetical protein